MRRYFPLPFVLVLLLFVTVGVLLYFYARYDPKMSTQHLSGRTPAEVIKELGSPTGGDPRKFGWNEQEYGPLIFYYSGPFDQHYAVVFQNNRVSEVKRARK